MLLNVVNLSNASVLFSSEAILENTTTNNKKTHKGINLQVYTLNLFINVAFTVI